MVSEMNAAANNTRFTMSNGFQQSFAREERSGTEKEVSFKEDVEAAGLGKKVIGGSKSSLKNAKIVQNMKMGMHNRKPSDQKGGSNVSPRSNRASASIGKTVVAPVLQGAKAPSQVQFGGNIESGASSQSQPRQHGVIGIPSVENLNAVDNMICETTQEQDEGEASIELNGQAASKVPAGHGLSLIHI